MLREEMNSFPSCEKNRTVHINPIEHIKGTPFYFLLSASIVGALSIGFAFIILAYDGSTVLTMSLKLTGVSMSPMAGLFVLAILFPWVGTLVSGG